MTDEDILISLAIGGEEPISVSILDEARAILRRDGLGIGYDVLNDAGLISAALEVDPATIFASPLARLLEEECSRVVSLDRPARATIARSAMPFGLATAALAAFFMLKLDQPKTKGGTALPDRSAVRLEVLHIDGPLGSQGVARSLSPQSEALARCADAHVSLHVDFTVAGNGLVQDVHASGAEAPAACVRAVIARTAFELHDEPSTVSAIIELHP